MARTPKLDAVLAEAVEQARASLQPLVDPSTIGEHRGVSADGDRLVTHRFEALLESYVGWEWYVTLGRASRAKEATVCESGILPGPGALLAPAWLPWSERMDPEELAAQQRAAAEEEAAARGETLPAEDEAATDSGAPKAAEAAHDDAADAASRGTVAEADDATGDETTDSSEDPVQEALIHETEDGLTLSGEAMEATADGEPRPARRRRRRR